MVPLGVSMWGANADGNAAVEIRGLETTTQWRLRVCVVSATCGDGAVPTSP